MFFVYGDHNLHGIGVCRLEASIWSDMTHWRDKPRTPTLYLNLSNKVYNIKTGRLELFEGFDVLYKDHAVSRVGSKR